jgi:NADPH:quinone reductase-like Zn-dependent oxidoreductase
MLALQVMQWRQPPELREVPVPLPHAGEVLVKVAASPINPSDIGSFGREANAGRTLPFTAGIEGSGLVVASGGGLLGSYLLGKQVACAVSPDMHGVWAEYFLAKVTTVLPLPAGLSLEQGSMAFVNPLTAYALLDIAKKRGHRAVVISAAASQLGRMLNRLAARKHIPIVNVVRRPAQAALLKNMGAPYVYDSSHPDFDAAFHAACAETQATLLFETVGGETTARLMRALPDKSTVFIVGTISGEQPQLDRLSMYRREITIEGFLLSVWLARRNLVANLLAANTALNLIDDTLYSDIQARFPLAEVERALAAYQENMTAGKVLFTP